VQRIKAILEKYSRWQDYEFYVKRIEGYRETDFSICIENSKSLLEGICKEICKQKNQPVEKTDSVSKVVRLAFGCLGHQPTATVNQIGQALANIGQQMGNFRNEIGATSHGKTVEELRKRENSIDILTGDFLIQSIETVCCFLIEAFETENPLVPKEAKESYEDNEDFNDYWNNIYGDITVAVGIEYDASEILYHLNYPLYKQALEEFKTLPKDETGNGE
jgi:hypothetical protein